MTTKTEKRTTASAADHVSDHIAQLDDLRLTHLYKVVARESQLRRAKAGNNNQVVPKAVATV